MWSVPAPGVVVAGTAVPVAIVWTLASSCTSTVYEPAAELLVVAETAVLDELVTVWPQVVELASLLARSRSVETALLILPYSETVVWIVVALVWSAVSGCCSIAISWVTIELTSRPLPMPAELIAPMPAELVVMGKPSSQTAAAGRADASISAVAGANLSGVRAGARRAEAQPLSRASTVCGSWLACATIAVPACCRIWARDRFAVSAAKSASMIRPRAADWFSPVICRFEIAKPKRLIAAP